jgi:tRNA G18 (ribose-2'-O)-methylase SpoU
LNCIPIHSFDDSRLDPFRNLKDRELARLGDRFIAEGENVVRRLLASGLQVESLLVSSRKEKAFRSIGPAEIPMFVVPDEIIRQVIGFKFHGGALAVGCRPAPSSLDALIPAVPSPALVAVAEEIANAENLGALIRVAAAFGAKAFLIGERCCDPYFRQCIRVSMGTIFSLPVHRSTDLIADLESLKARHGMEVLATVLDESATPLARLPKFPRAALVLGNEAQGLHESTLGACTGRITIPMKLGTDSLNVAVAAAVCFYHLTSESD